MPLPGLPVRWFGSDSQLLETIGFQWFFTGIRELDHIRTGWWISQDKGIRTLDGLQLVLDLVKGPRFQ